MLTKKVSKKNKTHHVFHIIKRTAKIITSEKNGEKVLRKSNNRLLIKSKANERQ